MGLVNRLQKSWNAFMSRDPTFSNNIGPSSYVRPDRPRFSRGNERSIVTSIYNKLALDVSSIEIKHSRLDENGRFIEEIKSGLNECLTVEANIDQTSASFLHDIVVSMIDEGKVAVVPVDTTRDPNDTSSYDINTMRTGKIIDWYPRHVKVRLYNDRIGRHEDVTLAKSFVAIMENPYYAVMNEPNSTLQRLIRKLNILDAIDEQSGSGKLDLIVQLPYVVKGEMRTRQAEERYKKVEDQLSNSKYGIAYIDAAEKITQLNRPVENNLMKQIEYLTSMLYGQLGMNQAILDGTADEKTKLNYDNGPVERFISTIVDEFNRKFLTKTARSQGQAITYFRDPFKLVPVSQIAEIADKMTRNEIMTSNEIRQILGMKPSDDPKADELRNKNLNQQDVTPVDQKERDEKENKEETTNE